MAVMDPGSWAGTSVPNVWKGAHVCSGSPHFPVSFLPQGLASMEIHVYWLLGRVGVRKEGTDR